MIEAEETKFEIAKQREVYLKLAKRGALLYFVSQDLSSVDCVYQFSLAWFLDLFCQCIASAHHSVTTRKMEERPSSARVS